jgi:hypothetical protein
MSAMFVSYVWHYLAARALYDELLRPAVGGNYGPLLTVGLVGAIAFLLGRWSAGSRRP